ncbi:MAG: glutaredoxin family protein [Hydrogenophaga sp.]|nr:glutaredoxin family protein [Hydrogenophaga sp.]
MNTLAARILRVGLASLWLFGFWLGALAAEPPAPVVAGSPVLQVFVRDGCPYCADAKTFLDGVQRQQPELQIVYRSVDTDPAARDALSALSQAHGVWPPGVPAFLAAGQLIVGFESASTTGQEVLRLIDTGTQVQKQTVDSALFGTLSAQRLGLPLFTLALGLLDGFNPCAMWVLLFLLAMLVRQNDRRRIVLIAGTFVFVSGAVYFAFMAAWLNVFLAVGLSQPVRLLLAGVALLIGAFNVKDFFALGRGFSFSIPEGAKPGLVARMHGVLQTQALAASLLGVAALAVVVNLVELLCTAGLPAIYTAVLAQQQLGPTAHLAYLALYIVGYIADDTLMVTLAVLALNRGKLTERAGRGLKLLSGVVMLALGLVLLLRPEWLV